MTLKTDRAWLGEAVARLLLQAGAVHISRGRPFFLSAGWASPVYVDCRLLIGDVGLRRRLIDLILAAIEGGLIAEGFDIVAGGETAGIPFAAWLAEGLDLPLRYVRKRPLGIGRNAQVEGGTVEGRRVLLMDDLTTDGANKAAFVRGLRAAGATVTEALTIFYYDVFPGVGDRLAQIGLTLHALATWDDVLRAAGPDDFARDERAELEAFLTDPIAWSVRHGGRAAVVARGR